MSAGRVVNGRHVGGRTLPERHGLKLAHYNLNLSAFPKTPSETHFSEAPAAQACLTDILGNDLYGCCTEADQYHRQALRQAAAGAPVYHPPVGVVLATYSRDGGYVPGDPSTDQGCDETVVLGNAAKLGFTNGAGVYRTSGFVLVPAKRDIVRATLSAFVGLAACAQLPDAYVQDTNGPGYVWKKAGPPNPKNGHCYTLTDQSDAELRMGTWGLPGRYDYEACEYYNAEEQGGSLYAELDEDLLVAAIKRAPDGLDWKQLVTDFQALGGVTVGLEEPSLLDRLEAALERIL